MSTPEKPSRKPGRPAPSAQTDQGPHAASSPRRPDIPHDPGAGLLRRSLAPAVVFVLLSGAGLSVVWALVPPQYRAFASLELQLVANGDGPSTTWLHARRMASQGVLEAVASRPDVRESDALGAGGTPISWMPHRSARGRLADALLVRPGDAPGVIEAEVVLADPAAAALLATAVVEEYARRLTKSAGSQPAASVPDRSREEAAQRAELRVLQGEVEELRRRLRVISPQELITRLRLGIEELLRQRDGIELELADARARLAQAEAEPPAIGPTSRPASSAYGQDPEWRRRAAALDEARGELEAALVHFGEQHPRIVAARHAVRQAEAALEQRTRELDARPAAGGEEATVDTRGSAALLRQRIEQLTAKHASLEALIARRSRELSDSLEAAEQLSRRLSRIDEVRAELDAIGRERAEHITQSTPPEGVRAILPAYPPERPDERRRQGLSIIVLAVAAIMAALVGVRRPRRSAAEAPVSPPAEAPLTPAAPSSDERPWPAPFRGQLPRRPETGGERSRAEKAAAIRHIREALLERLAGDQPAVITVTSAAAGAGNTTVATLLARSLAAAGRAVLLVDANPHRPAATERLGAPAGQDLLSALRSPSPHEFVRETQTSGLDVLGLAEPLGAGETALLAARAGTLLDGLCERHGLVLVDGPPLPGDAVALSLARESDGVIFVAREGHCRRSDIAEALAALRLLGARLAGTVFNATTAGRQPVGAPS